MNGQILKIGVVAPGSPLKKEAADRVYALAKNIYADRSPDIVFHPQCFSSHGHFAGTDEERATAFLDIANDPSFEAVWFARGGYGAARLLDRIIPNLTAAAKIKTYLGYSDAGSLLGALYAEGLQRIVHGPMPTDINREDGDKAVARALRYLVDGAAESLEPTPKPNARLAAFNITILSHLIGTRHQPDLTGHVLMVEDVSEHLYSIDRSLCHITANDNIRKTTGLMMGRCADIPENVPAFGQTVEDIAQHWCDVSGIPYLGRADIGHDVDNKIVPFGDLLTS